MPCQGQLRQSDKDLRDTLWPVPGYLSEFVKAQSIGLYIKYALIYLYITVQTINTVRKPNYEIRQIILCLIKEKKKVCVCSWCTKLQIYK